MFKVILAFIQTASQLSFTLINVTYHSLYLRSKQIMWRVNNVGYIPNSASRNLLKNSMIVISSSSFNKYSISGFISCHICYLHFPLWSCYLRFITSSVDVAKSGKSCKLQPTRIFQAKIKRYRYAMTVSTWSNSRAVNSIVTMCFINSPCHPLRYS